MWEDDGTFNGQGGRVNGRHGWHRGEDARAIRPSVPKIPMLTPGASGDRAPNNNDHGTELLKANRYHIDDEANDDMDTPLSPTGDNPDQPLPDLRTYSLPPGRRSHESGQVQPTTTYLPNPTPQRPIVDFGSIEPPPGFNDEPDDMIPNLEVSSDSDVEQCSKEKCRHG